MLSSVQIHRLEKIAELKRIGALTDEEFDREKGKILSGDAPVRSASLSFGDYSQPFHIPAKPGSFAEWLAMPLNRYAEFKGRASRREYWPFTIAVSLAIAILTLAMVGSIAGDEEGDSILFAGLLGLFSLAVIVPSLAVQVRRFHDQDRSGWFVLLNLIPYVGPIVVFVFMLLEGTDGENRFGPNPLIA